MPASELVPGQRARLGAQPPRGGAALVGVEVAVGQGAAAAGDRQQVDQRPQARLVVAGRGVDHLVECLGGQPVVDRQPAGVEQRAPVGVDAGVVELCRAPRRRRPSKLCGRPSSAATSRPIDSAITLSETFIISRSRSHQRRRTAPRRSGRSPSRPARRQHRHLRRVDPQARRPARGRRPGRESWSAATRRVTGWVRPPSSITDSIGAMSPPSMSSGIPARRHRRPAVGADVHLHGRHGDAAPPHLIGQVADARRVRGTRCPRRAAPPTASGHRRPRARPLRAGRSLRRTRGGQPGVAVEGRAAPRRR